jgi:hypothetical protein
MPQINAFCRFGNFAFSARKPKPQIYYEMLIANWGDAFDWTVGNTMEAIVYAQAMALGSAACVIERANNQKFPGKAFDMIPALEKDSRVVAKFDASLAERRAALLAIKQYNEGAAEQTVTQAMIDALGSDFIALYTFPLVDLPAFSTSGASFVRPDTPVKLFKLDSPIAVTGSTWQFRYSSLLAPSDRLTVGDKVMFSPENDLAEEVTITATPSDLVASGVFAKAHNQGDKIRAGAFHATPYLTRYILVILTQSACRDRAKRQLVHEVMHRHTTGVTRWSLCAEDPSSSGDTIESVVGEPIGETTIGVLGF